MSEVGIAQLRRDLKAWLARVQAGEDVIITDRGKPVARLSGVATATALERLVAQGRVSQPRRSRTPAGAVRRVQGAGSVSEHIVDERDARRG